MDSMPESEREERFVRLEIKAAYLEKLAQELNEVVTAQGDIINDLTKRLLQLERQSQAGSEDRELTHERPPHY
jgi:uncharacterized coiled-coil protein SlyX